MIDSAARDFFVKYGIAPCRIAVAVSGGIDSTALLLLLADLRAEGFEVVAAHVNHHLRGADSDADEAFVRDLCASLGIDLHVADGPVDPLRVRDRGLEAAAREVRYARLHEIRAIGRADYVATAHQKNDQAETVLMRLLTGSGIAGLRGIHPVREDRFIRPLLEVTRGEIEAFLAARGVTPRLDRSNDDPRFLRNRVRVLVRELNAVDTLAAAAEQARAQWPILERAIDDAEGACASMTADATTFQAWPDDLWLRGALLRRHIRRLDPHARDFDAARIAGELDSVKRLSVTRHVELLRTGGGWTLRRRLGAFEVEVGVNEAAVIPGLGKTIHVRAGQAGLPLLHSFQLPDGALPFFTVRNRRPGDRFEAGGPKMLKDVLIDRRIAAEARDRIPLLVWNGEIVWVAGVGVSDRFEVTSPEGVTYAVWMEDSGAADHDRDHRGLQR